MFTGLRDDMAGSHERRIHPGAAITRVKFSERMTESRTARFACCILLTDMIVIRVMYAEYIMVL